jgi:serine/threonine protein kinase
VSDHPIFYFSDSFRFPFLFFSCFLFRLLETYNEGDNFYTVNELVEGGELFDRIVSKAHYTEKEARDLMKNVLETIAYLHKMGIVHRDLKPEKILLTSGTRKETDERKLSSICCLS